MPVRSRDVKKHANIQTYRAPERLEATPRLAKGDEREVVIERCLLAPMREKCAMALYGISGGLGVTVEKADEELREMTTCPEYPAGLDFTTEEGSGRFVLYKHRETIQAEYGLYFKGLHGGGIKFTIHPLVGMQWREEEFEDRAKKSTRQLQRMWDLALSALGNNAPPKADVIRMAARDRVVAIELAAAQIQSSLVVELAEPLSRPTRRPGPRP